MRKRRKTHSILYVLYVVLMLYTEREYGKDQFVAMSLASQLSPWFFKLLDWIEDRVFRRNPLFVNLFCTNQVTKYVLTILYNYLFHA